MAVAVPKIKLYTNHNCPWAHRAHIALAELNVSFEEEIIDLWTPRSPEYLSINPRGQVPTLIYNGQTITESAIVATFLADAYPGKLWPASTDPEGPLVRSKINYFVDAYFSKAQGHWGRVLAAKSDQDEQAAVNAYVEAVSKEVEPLLADAKPFFGGSNTLTLAEVLAGSWVLRVYNLPKHGIVPASVLEGLAEKAPNFDRWAREVEKHPNVRCIWDEERILEGTKAWIAKMRAA
ncbi:hypothetical protein LTR56_017116 [Elasticomyces elasticus]|nr:hypothetical protein LTR22_021814 [Elasticomyces elasticus]KAK3630971.1 hypothetical protein LTR56_017116 [Elasticomyces elasticus]KAK4908784.1 hypothetical protein LTR49_022350 [Elasticomyces elasticus]KAK5748786.1 hypothetical protein LTS12_021137 [Elasticomyces elasticus]